MPKSGALVRFNENMKTALLRDVGAAAVQETYDILMRKEAAIVARIRDRWIGDEKAHAMFAQTSKHWFPHFHSIDLRLLNPDTYISLKIETQPLPANPAWDHDSNRSTYFLSLPEWNDDLEEILQLRQTISDDRNRVTDRLRYVLKGMRYVRDVREALPELDTFLPPDRYDGDASVPTSRALAIDYGPIRDMLRQHKIGVPEA